MAHDGAVADVECVADLAVGHPLSDQADDLVLPRRGGAEPLGSLVIRFGRPGREQCEDFPGRLVNQVNVVAGPAAIGIGAGRQSILQEQTSDAYRGRVFGAMGATEGLATMVGLAMGGLLGDAVGLVPIMSAGAVIRILGGALVFLLLPAGALTRPSPWQWVKPSRLCNAVLAIDANVLIALATAGTLFCGTSALRRRTR